MINNTDNMIFIAKVHSDCYIVHGWFSQVVQHSTAVILERVYNTARGESAFSFYLGGVTQRKRQSIETQNPMLSLRGDDARPVSGTAGFGGPQPIASRAG
ncbi:hypothetical protein GF1_15410 [Desulfolithobacter dissulfuricans]|uniref:Uncharacterized protein n=1 Tax=Desulfolithobacter dissulfuricans TaxID=2795293 RepID=A0A915U1M5_9BACT|nr:hypothetical protein GF1_15410 [Desulfolithobacter dissulfuricans]